MPQKEKDDRDEPCESADLLEKEKASKPVGKAETLHNSTVTPSSNHSPPQSRSKLCLLIPAIVVVAFICTMESATLKDRFVVLKQWPNIPSVVPAIRQNNGYLMVSCNGGLNQMRTGICDMVAIARFLNVTLIFPELDNTSYWHDQSTFEDIFDTDYFIGSLADEIRILKELPSEEKRRLESQPLTSMEPILFPNMSYYYNTILPQIQKHKVLHFLKADARIANNGPPEEFQKTRCRACYEALRFTPHIEEVGRKIVRRLKQKGPFLVIHLRYEMDMLSFTGCTLGLSHDEIVEVMTLRKSYPWWKSIADPRKKRKAGLCPLMPDEIALGLQALGIDRNIQIYIASGEIYGGEARIAKLAEAFPNMVRKETLLDSSDLSQFQNHSNAMAALDYIVAVESDIFVPTFGGNMAYAVEGHRRYLGFRRTITVDRKLLVSLIDQYKIGKRSWSEFCFIMKAAHAGNRMGKPKERLKIPDQPFKEDYFYSNPLECLAHSPTSPLS
ncbi:unnamed protein product [Linum trigynum]|uniref:O-fucosyltransferase family protein n=1 Tax=Linum trigynum TaxID=586398 RepID=A0AAV2FBV8_9ROSI